MICSGPIRHHVSSEMRFRKTTKGKTSCKAADVVLQSSGCRPARQWKSARKAVDVEPIPQGGFPYSGGTIADNQTEKGRISLD